MNQKLKVRIISLSAILVISVLLALLMNLTIEAARKGRTEERFVALIQETDDICGQTDQIVEEDEDWREENLWYKRSLVTFFEHMDKHPNTLAAIYNNDLVLLAKRNPIYMGYPLSLNDHPDLVNRLKTERLGRTEIMHSFTTKEGEKKDHPIKIYFRRVPNFNDDDFFIAVVGMAFEQEFINLSSDTYRLIYLIYGLAAVSFAALIFLMTNHLLLYRKTINDLLKQREDLIKEWRLIK